MLLITTFACILLMGCSSNQYNLTPGQWIIDIDILAKQLPEVHRNLFFQMPEDEFTQQIAALKSQIQTDSLSDKEIIFSLMQIVASVGDAHTSIDYYYRPYNLLPVYTYFCEDGLLILGATEPYKQLIGTKIVAINDINIEEIRHRLARFIPHENEYWLTDKIPEYIANADLLKFIEVTGSTDTLTIGFVDHGVHAEKEVATTISNHISAIDMIYYFDYLDLELPMAWRVGNPNYWYHYFEEDQTIYFQYNQCINMPTESFSYFSEKLFNFISNHPVSAMIVDVRFNTGGNSLLFTNDFSPKLRRFVQSNEPKLYTIIGRRTFSSGFFVATEMKQQYGSLLLGEPAGNRPNHYGDQRHFTLPNSKLVVNYSIRYWEFWDIDGKVLNPDIFVKIYSTDILSGRDRSLEQAIYLTHESDWKK